MTRKKEREKEKEKTAAKKQTETIFCLFEIYMTRQRRETTSRINQQQAFDCVCLQNDAN